jgi:signal transduction histidine kinase
VRFHISVCRPQAVPYVVNEVLEDACALVDARAEAKRISIKRELTQGTSYDGDEAFLHQLLLIFLDNAIRYSPPETEISVSLTTERQFVWVRFEDRGFRISDDQRKHIFERFYRVVQPGSDEASSGGLHRVSQYPGHGVCLHREFTCSAVNGTFVGEPGHQRPPSLISASRSLEHSPRFPVLKLI